MVAYERKAIGNHMVGHWNEVTDGITGRGCWTLDISRCLFLPTKFTDIKVEIQWDLSHSVKLRMHILLQNACKAGSEMSEHPDAESVVQKSGGVVLYERAVQSWVQQGCLVIICEQCRSTERLLWPKSKLHSFMQNWQWSERQGVLCLIGFIPLFKVVKKATARLSWWHNTGGCSYIAFAVQYSCGIVTLFQSALCYCYRSHHITSTVQLVLSHCFSLHYVTVTGLITLHPQYSWYCHTVSVCTMLLLQVSSHYIHSTVGIVTLFQSALCYCYRSHHITSTVQCSRVSPCLWPPYKGIS